MGKAFDRYAKAYDETVSKYFENTKTMEPVEIEMREDFMSRLAKRASILDVGCGPGRDAKFFSERGFSVIGIDLSPRMIGMAKKIAPKARFEIMDFLDLRFEKGSFGGIWFNAGLIAVGKRHAKSVLRSVNRILKAGGILFVGVKEGKGEGFELDKRYGNGRYFSYFSEEEIRELIVKSGFEVLKLTRPKLESKYHTHPWICVLCKKDRTGRISA